MAGALKDVLNMEAVAWLADCLASASPSFDAKGFIAACKDGLDGMELKQRAAHIGTCMGRFLPQHFPDAAAIVARSLGPEVPATGENGLSVLRYFAHDSFIEQFGTDHPEAAFTLQGEVTNRASCEFSIRAFLIKHPVRTYSQMLKWAQSDNAHHRRLASEGSRPRLPWGQRLRAFQSDPATVIAILELLKDDPVRYVQRSVANNINDISKDWPDQAVALCKDWLEGASENRKWIVKHALRDLVKKGHSGALALSGASARPKIRIGEVSLSPKRLKIGGKLDFTVEVHSEGREAQDLLIDFVIDYVKANGKTTPKVFKLAKLSLEPSAIVPLRGSVSFKDMTTRKHFSGRHVLSLQINSHRFELTSFQLNSG